MEKCGQQLDNPSISLLADLGSQEGCCCTSALSVDMVIESYSVVLLSGSHYVFLPHARVVSHIRASCLFHHWVHHILVHVTAVWGLHTKHLHGSNE